MSRSAESAGCRREAESGPLPLCCSLLRDSKKSIQRIVSTYVQVPIAVAIPGVVSSVKKSSSGGAGSEVSQSLRARRPGQGTMRRLRTGLIPGFGLWRGLMLDGLPVLGEPAPDPLGEL